MAGWVSLSWMATLSGSALQSALPRRKRRTRSASEQATRKYSCTKRSPWPMARGVVGIEHAGERLGRERLGQRADEVAAAERLEVEVVGRGRGPEAQRVDRLAAVAHDRPVERDADQASTAARRSGCSVPPRISNEQFSLTSTFSSGRATSHGIGAAQPVVRLLVLPAVLDGLPEDAVLVAQPVAHGRELHRGHRVEEARGQAPEPAVAQAGVGLLLEQAEPVEVLLA